MLFRKYTLVYDELTNYDPLNFHKIFNTKSYFEDILNWNELNWIDSACLGDFLIKLRQFDENLQWKTSECECGVFTVQYIKWENNW